MKTTYIRFLRKTAFGLIAAVVLPVPVFADLCRNPNVKIIYGKEYRMEVRKIAYQDGCDDYFIWRIEDVNNTEIPSG